MKRGSTPGRDYRRPVTHDTHSQTIDACHSWCSWLDKSSWWDRNRQCNFRLLIVVKRSAKCHCLISPYTLKRIGQFNLFAQGGTVGSRGGPSEAALFGPEGPLFCRGQSGGTAFKGGLSTAWQFYSPHPSHSTLHTPHMHTLTHLKSLWIDAAVLCENRRESIVQFELACLKKKKKKKERDEWYVVIRLIV